MTGGIFKGRWYRSAVKLEGGTIIPIPPFQEYDPFDFYYPVSDLRQGQKSLYLEFLAVDTESPEAIFKFCEKWGVLGSHLSLMKMEQARWTELLRRNRAPLPKDHDANLIDLNSPRILGIIGKIGKPDVTKYSPEELCFPSSVNYFREVRNSFAIALDPPEELGSLGALGMLNSGIHHSHIRPQITWNIQKEKHEFFWPSLTLEGYFHLMAMWDLLGPGKIIPCPHCQNPFLAASDRTKFCSPSCYNLNKVQKYQRKKKAEALAAQKGKKRKATTSTTKTK